jgi:hypothetical protein
MLVETLIVNQLFMNLPHLPELEYSTPLSENFVPGS